MKPAFQTLIAQVYLYRSQFRHSHERPQLQQGTAVAAAACAAAIDASAASDTARAVADTEPFEDEKALPTVAALAIQTALIVAAVAGIAVAAEAKPPFAEQTSSPERVAQPR